MDVGLLDLGRPDLNALECIKDDLATGGRKIIVATESLGCRENG